MADAHTPGPWTEPCNFGVSRFEVQGSGKQIAVINKIEDARLIAAAPDLLEMLRVSVTLLKKVMPAGDAASDELLTLTIEVSELAIAKATGAAA